MDYTIVYDSSPKQDDTKILWEGLAEHASLMRGHEPGKSFAFFIRNKNKRIKGGCCGYIFYGCLYVDLLWIDISLRGNGYGTKLMKCCETLARDNRCHFMTLNTMDWEALDFYKKLGFFVEFERHGFDKNSIFYFFTKRFCLERI